MGIALNYHWPVRTVALAEVCELEFREGIRWVCRSGRDVVSPAFKTRTALKEWQAPFCAAWEEEEAERLEKEAEAKRQALAAAAPATA
jgi:hypothetical protein